MTQPNDTPQPATHTPGPWRITGQSCRDYEGAEIGTGNKTVAVILTADAVEVTQEERANSRRIVAAVNACQGISTEALERGVVDELRHILRELLTAAGDLDAALDGATDEFDAERAKLTPALRAAQAVLDSGTAIDLHELLANRRQIAAIWCIEDVQEVRPDLSDDQAWEVLRKVERRHDATIGLTWDTLEMTAKDLFGDAPEINSPE